MAIILEIILKVPIEEKEISFKLSKIRRHVDLDLLSDKIQQIQFYGDENHGL